MLEDKSVLDAAQAYGRTHMKSTIINVLDKWADEYRTGHQTRATILRAIEKIEEIDLH